MTSRRVLPQAEVKKWEVAEDRFDGVFDHENDRKKTLEKISKLLTMRRIRI